jgi:acyl-CoA thioesterase-1
MRVLKHPILLAALLVVAINACSSRRNPAGPSSSETGRHRIVVLGDSLAVSPSISESFPGRIQARINGQGLRWTITNAGVSGDTTAGGLRRLDPLLGNDVGVLLLELGANDGLRGVEVSNVEANLGTIIQVAQGRDIRVLLCGMEVPPIHGFDYTIAFHHVFGNLAQRYGLTLVPFLLGGVVLNPDLNGPDGIHPNAAGAERIAETIWPYLEPMLRETDG